MSAPASANGDCSPYPPLPSSLPVQASGAGYGVLLYYCVASLGSPASPELEGTREDWTPPAPGASEGELAAGGVEEDGERASPVASVCAWLRSTSLQLGLVGRIRVSPQGLNVTVAGPWPALEAHIALVSADPRFSACDFKLAPCPWPPAPHLAKECGLERLSVRAVQELVTLGAGRHVNLSHAAPHLSPEEFHHRLLLGQGANRSANTTISSSSSCAETAPGAAAAGVHSLHSYQSTGIGFGASSEEEGDTSRGQGTEAEGGREERDTLEATTAASVPPSPAATAVEDCLISRVGAGAEEVVLLDTRNVYETRIGRFVPPPRVRVLDPGIRQFSDLPRWIDEHEEELRGRTILMYCTGGVRCEAASAYIRSKGPDFASTFQLSGGIVRYLEAFPDGGAFRGKNFVFDHRLAVGPADTTRGTEVLGTAVDAASVARAVHASGAAGGVCQRPQCPLSDIIGRCIGCGAATDDYAPRSRCPHCRMLILLCAHCLDRGTRGEGALQVCELCAANRVSSTQVPQPPPPVTGLRLPLSPAS